MSKSRITWRPVLIVMVLVAALSGALAGVGGFTFIYARGASYMTNDATACMNCHVMREQYEGWTKGSHHNVATCNDCHAPHDLVGKYSTKAINGFNHSLAFTTGRFHEPIQITERNFRITENACRHCHQDIVNAIDPVPEFHRGERTVEGGWTSLSCVRCHENVGHMH